MSLCFPFSDSLSSGDDEDYDEDPEDAGNGNGEFLINLYSHTIMKSISFVFHEAIFPMLYLNLKNRKKKYDNFTRLYET